MKAWVLAYHSHNISGTSYAANDHVAFASDLQTIARSGATIVPLHEVVRAMHTGTSTGGGGGALVGLSFDDGPLFDYADFIHPEFGPQRSFLNIMRDFREKNPGIQPHMHATSFVIGSPSARRAMERAEECGFPYLDDWLTDAWWNDAIDTGLMGIGNHSWDHVHPTVERVATVSQDRGNFGRVESYPDADSEIRKAADFINERTRGRCSLFAFPFGHTNEFLVNDYLPLHQDQHGMQAAFATGGRAVTAGDPVWNIPRAVCGEHWTSPEGLAQLLAS